MRHKGSVEGVQPCVVGFANGAVNEAEFFAVATESYSEKPRLMKATMPDLYEELREFYGGDPAADEEAAVSHYAVAACLLRFVERAVRAFEGRC
jgi:Mlc titration factor MtfA (ptsG expression regulator)